LLFLFISNEPSTSRGMKRFHMLSARSIFAGALLLFLQPAFAAGPPGFSVRDSIQMSVFNDPNGLSRHPEFHLSPDGRFFYVVTTRGIISKNAAETSLWLFDIGRIRSRIKSDDRRSSPPRLLFKATATPQIESVTAYTALLSQVRWSADSKLIYFLAQNVSGNRVLTRVDTISGVSRALSPECLDVSTFDLHPTKIVYIASDRRDQSTVNKGLLGAVLGPGSYQSTGAQLLDLMEIRTVNVPKKPQLWVIDHGASRRVPDPTNRISAPDLLDYYGRVLAISPSGRSVVCLLPVLTIPSAWEQYVPAHNFEHWRVSHSDVRLISPVNNYHLREYVLIDLQTGDVRPLMRAPHGSTLAYTGYQNQVVWSKDGTHILLTDTFLPLDVPSEGLPIPDVTNCAVAAVDVASHTSTCVEHSDDPQDRSLPPASIAHVGYTATQGEVQVDLNSPDGSRNTRTYQFRNHEWQLESSTASHSTVTGTHGVYSGLDLTLRQTLNDRPMLWAQDAKSGHELMLWDPNPQLENVPSGEATTFHWTDRTGFTWTGGLIKPLGYREGTRYPLVIQTHGFLDGVFLTDGIYPTAMAARPLATAGFVVLQVRPRPDHAGTAAEAPDQVEGFVSAIDNLSALGLVDPKRVGIIGYSRTAWYVEEALIKQPTRFKAATIADGVDESYMQYMLIGEGNPVFETEEEKINEGKPFGSMLRHWAASAASFNLDKVTTPLRIEALGPYSLLMEWELYSSLHKQKKPVQLIYLSEAQHILQKPLDRIVSQQGNIDWFTSWLLPKEPLATTPASAPR
jgi:dipeptidyl aminopeptidase/acylaminoacyl peptidase